MTDDALYGRALDALLALQKRAAPTGLPRFGRDRMIAAMEDLPEWFLQHHLGVLPGCHGWDEIEAAFGVIANIAGEQPYVLMHGDFHIRNLPIVAGDPPGILDVQGTMLGPLTCDLASLLRDDHAGWPPERVDAWAEAYRRRLVEAGLTQADARQFRRWFDITGLLRHITLLGRFCRLCYRDGDPQSLDRLPRLLDGVLDIARQYDEFTGLARLLETATAGRHLTRKRTA